MPTFSNPDIHQDLGPRMTAASMDEALEAIRHAIPEAHCEGCMGTERSWWIGWGNKAILVAHQWPVRRNDGMGRTYYRMKSII